MNSVDIPMEATFTIGSTMTRIAALTSIIFSIFSYIREKARMKVDIKKTIFNAAIRTITGYSFFIYIIIDNIGEQSDVLRGSCRRI